jgi:formylmethanofuran dehydrogenase subunit B
MLSSSQTDAVTCLGCGCLCDDLTIQVEEGRVVSVGRGCDLGLRWFSSAPGGEDGPSAWIEGQVAEVSEALDRAAELLRASRAPLMFGLTRTSTETVREALALADLTGARVWLDRSEADLGRVAAFSQSGRVSSTLGEVRNRADVVVFLGADPVVTHPRHLERYSVEPRGRFAQGRQARYVVVAGDETTATALQADLFLPCPAQYEYEWLSILRAIVQGRGSDFKSFFTKTGINRSTLDVLVSLLRQARYGAIFYQCRQTSVDNATACWEAVSALVRALNGPASRCVLLGMGAPGNLAGAEAALTWQTGFARNVDLRLGVPTAIEEFTSVDELIEQGGVDCIMTVGAMGSAVDSRPGAIPVIAIGPEADRMGNPVPSVAIATATAGIEGGGTVMRSDGVVLPLRPPLRSRRPGEGECLRGLVIRIAAQEGQTDD